MIEFSERLKRRRTALGMTQSQLAEVMQTCQSHISELESGRYNPSISTLQRWAGALGFDVRLTDRQRP